MSALNDLGSRLESKDPEERREAVLLLGRAGEEAVPFLLRALEDSDWRVRKTTVEALADIGGQKVIAGLVQKLSAQDNAGARNSAIEALVRLGSEAVEPLFPLLSERDPDVRKFVVDVLGDLRDGRAVPYLLDRLKDDDENVRVAAAEALGKIGDKRAVEALIGCLSSYEQGWLDYAAAEALGEIGDERALGPLLSALSRSSLREPVLEALGKIGNVNTLTPLINGLADPLRIVREVSATALCSIYNKCLPDDRRRIAASVRTGISDRGLNFLEELVETSGGELQKAGVTILGWSGRAGAVPKLLNLLQEETEEAVAQALRNIGASTTRFLLEHLDDENVLVRRTAAMVLGDLGRQEAEEALINMLSDENGHVRGAAAEALGRLKSRKAAAALVKLLEDEYENVQECAIRALAEIGDESVLDDLLSDFTSHDASLRRNIVLLLGKFKTGKAAEALSFALKDEEPEVRKAVVSALGDISGDRALRSLLLAITDDDPEVRMLAAEALAKTGAAEAGDALVPLLSDEDLWVRAAAARGLGLLGVERYGAVLAGHLKEATDIFLLSLIDVLGKSSVPEALNPLLDLADHADAEIRKIVLQSLSSYEWIRVRPVVIARLFDHHWSVRKTAAEILRHHRDPAVDQILLRMAAEDPDPSVQFAAREALGS